MLARAEGRVKRRVVTQLLRFPSRSPFNCPAQKFFVLTALSPSGFDPDGLDRVRMRECVRARVCACAHSHTGALEAVTGMFLSKS